MTPLISLARIKREGSATEIIKPINIPNIITWLILVNLPKKSPTLAPISDMDRSTPVKNIESPRITPRHPNKNLIIRVL